MRIDAVDGDTIGSRILQFGSIPTILDGVTRGPQNDHSNVFTNHLLQFIYVDLVAPISTITLECLYGCYYNIVLNN